MEHQLLLSKGSGVCKMKKHWLALLLAMAILTPALSAYADDDDHRTTNAFEMSMLGLAAASAVGAGTYLAYRRKVRSRK